LFTSFKELSGATAKDKKILSVVNHAVSEHIRQIIEYVSCDIFKIGMHINIYVILPKEISSEIIAQLNSVKEK